MDQRRLLATVLTMAGIHTTVVTARTCRSDVAASHSQLLRLHRRHLSVVRQDCRVQHKCAVFSGVLSVIIYYLFDNAFDGGISLGFQNISYTDPFSALVGTFNP